MTGYVQLTSAVLTEIESAMFGKNYSRRDLANASGISYPNITAILSRTRKQMRIRTAVKLSNTLDLVWSENDAQFVSHNKTTPVVNDDDKPSFTFPISTTVGNSHFTYTPISETGEDIARRALPTRMYALNEVNFHRALEYINDLLDEQ